METEHTRRSDRVYLELHIVVTGIDATGRGFMDETRTLVLSRHGAKILSCRKLAPEQELRIRCTKTRREAIARIVGKIGGDAEGYYYGIEFLEPDASVWAIEFPPLAESEMAVGRVLLECEGCQTQEVTYLDVFAAEVLMAE